MARRSPKAATALCGTCAQERRGAALVSDAPGRRPICPRGHRPLVIFAVPSGLWN